MACHVGQGQRGLRLHGLETGKLHTFIVNRDFPAIAQIEVIPHRTASISEKNEARWETFLSSSGTAGARISRGTTNASRCSLLG
jgi:hypothetical protein